MRNKLLVIFCLVLAPLLWLFFSEQTQAQTSGCQLTIDRESFSPTFNGTASINSSSDCFKSAQDYFVFWYPQGQRTDSGGYAPTATVVSPTELSFNFNLQDTARGNEGAFVVSVCSATNVNCPSDQLVGTTSTTISNNALDNTPSSGGTINPELPVIDKVSQPICFIQAGDSITFKATGVDKGQTYKWFYPTNTFIGLPLLKGEAVADSESISFTLTPDDTKGAARLQRVCLDRAGSTRDIDQNCINFQILSTPPTGDTSCQRNALVPTPTLMQLPALPPCKLGYKNDDSGNRTEVSIPPPPDLSSMQGLGSDSYNQRVSDYTEKLNSIDGCLEVYTAVGTISTQPNKFIESIMSFLLSISGAIALILIIRAGYELMTSRGDPEKVGHARERLTSAIVGLLFLIFSLVILEIIGVDILKIPGFENSDNTPTQQTTKTKSTSPPAPTSAAIPSPPRKADAANCGTVNQAPCNDRRNTQPNGCKLPQYSVVSGKCIIIGG